MALTPLTRVQQATVLALVEARRLDVVPADLARATSFLRQAEELGRIDGIESAFLYGSFAARMLGDAGPAPHDIDVMVLGEPDVDAVYEACARIEAAVHRPVNPAILTPEEFAASSGFLDSVRSGPAVAVIGELPWR